MKSIKMFMAVILMLSAVGLIGCGPRVIEYDPGRPVMMIEEGQAAPYTGWILPCDVMEFLLKKAESSI